MASKDVIDTRELNALMKRMSKVDVKKFIRSDLVNTAFEIKAEASEYPLVIPDRSKPRWYERGLGQAYRRADGGITISRTSEKLSQGWFVRGVSQGVKIGARASYAGWVHGAKQTRLHARNRWKKLSKVAQSEVNKLTKRMAKKIGREMVRG